MKTGVIDSDGNYHKMNYWDIYEYAKTSCLQYASLNEKNERSFYWFAKEYKDFEPYFDFLLCKMGYTLVNPLYTRNVIEYYKNNRLILQNVRTLNKNIDDLKCDKKTKVSHFRCSEACLNKEIFNIKNADNGIITPKGQFYTFGVDKIEVHEHLAEQLLNQYLIKDQELCELYLDYIKKEYAESQCYLPLTGHSDVISFLSRILGFVWFQKNYGSVGYYLFNQAFVTEELQPYIDLLDNSSDYSRGDFHESVNISEDEEKRIKKIISRL